MPCSWPPPPRGRLLVTFPCEATRGGPVVDALGGPLARDCAPDFFMGPRTASISQTTSEPFQQVTNATFRTELKFRWMRAMSPHRRPATRPALGFPPPPPVRRRPPAAVPWASGPRAEPTEPPGGSPAGPVRPPSLRLGWSARADRSADPGLPGANGLKNNAKVAGPGTRRTIRNNANSREALSWSFLMLNAIWHNARFGPTGVSGRARLGGLPFEADEESITIFDARMLDE
jgi:hypothetical protein